uniref:Uncharacterized protein n=1 Tax=Podoviridae sp. ctYFd1 TaxID=2826560 RepID=A0A8S5R228_9CAUD|nr:MAG TPA: hypothetical protein [Podoviridae sp. ctYFd1]DAL73139.1 MAG TPA: hypothetical protein [Caudoviricetes sp.]DAN03397.1 MAG TPA: hypothetical protein [Caudoviricetes sp.]
MKSYMFLIKDVIYQFMPLKICDHYSLVVYIL